MKKIVCRHCLREFDTEAMGTKNRNHCPFCLCSLHVDIEAGDRAATCHGVMMPVGLIFKHEGVDKYGNERIGELMLVHQCTRCNKTSINRIAGDDDPEKVLQVLKRSLASSDYARRKLKEAGLDLLDESDELEIRKQLFGKIE